MIALCNPIAIQNTMYAPLKADSNNRAPTPYTITNNGAVPSTGIFGESNGAYEFNGSSNYMNIPTSNLVTSKGCVSLWFKKDNPTANQVIFGNTQIGVSDYLQINAIDGLRVRVSDDNFQSAGTDYQDTNWHHCVLNWDASSTWKLYMDGELIHIGAVSENPTNTYYMYLGVLSNGNSIYSTPYYFDGKITEFRYLQNYNYNAGEVSIMYIQKGRLVY